jgi:hypothetical protein
MKNARTAILSMLLALLSMNWAWAQKPDAANPDDPFKIDVSGSAFDDDGDKPEIKGMRFVDRGDHILDKKTGLLWQKDGAASGKKNFDQAAQYAADLKLGGFADWRVPTRDELAGIFPADKAPFANSAYNPDACCEGPKEFRSYWTSEMDIGSDREDYAFVYHWYAKGGANNCFASKNFVYVRCVHDPVKKE